MQPTNQHDETPCLPRDVASAIQSQAKSPKDAENLVADLRDRLDTPDFEEDLKNRPIQDIIDEIRKDLGLKTTVARIAPSQCGTTQDETTKILTQPPGPPYPTGS